MVSQGIKAVRDASPASEVAIHTDLGNHIMYDGIAWLIEWYGNLTANLDSSSSSNGSNTKVKADGRAAGRISIDRIGLSMYVRSKPPLATENLLENVGGEFGVGVSEHPISVLSGR